MSNALHEYAKLFEKYATAHGAMGAILTDEDCLALANEMRIDADIIESENAKLREDLKFEHLENEWMREFGDRMAKHCGTKDYPSLVDYVTKLEKENAKLLELNNIRILQAQHCEYLDAENAKLRKLVRDMWNWLAPTAMGGSRVWLQKLSNRMRKLGIWED